MARRPPVMARIGGGLGLLVSAYKAAIGGREAWSAWVQAPTRTAERGVPSDAGMAADADRYCTSDDVMAAVSTLCDAAASLPLRVLQDHEPVEDHPLQLLLDHGNWWQGGYGYRQRLYFWLFLTGESYLLIDRTNPVLRRLPNEVWPFSGLTLNPVPGGERVISHYVYQAPGTRQTKRVEAQDVVPVIGLNPRSPVRGISPLMPLRLALDSEYAAKSANRDLFANGLMADTVVGVRGLTTKGRADLEDQLKARHGGAGQKHGTLFVDSDGTSVNRLTLSPRDAEFIELDRMTTRDVAKAYRIPPMFLGQLDNATYSNYQTGWRALYELAVLPAARQVAAALTAHLASQYGPGLEVVPDTSHVAALREDEQQRAATFAQYVAGGADPQWALDRVTPGEDVPPEAIAARWSAVAPRRPEAEERAAAPLRRKQANARGARLVQQARDAIVARHGAGIAAAVARQVEQAEAALTALLADKGAKQTDPQALADLLLDEVDPAGLEAALRSASLGAIDDAGTAYDVAFDLGIDLDRVDPQTLAWARDNAAAAVREVSGTTRERLRAAVADALEQGEGLAGVRSRLREAFAGTDGAGLYADRIETIAQTELAAAYGYGAERAMAEAGIEWQEWLYSGLPDTRHGPERSKGNGQVVAVGRPFSINGYDALYPGDPDLPIGERARCKCVVVPADPPQEAQT